MYRSNIKWDKEEKERVTRLNGYRIQDMRDLLSKIDNDPKGERRIKEQTCRYCFYHSTLSMSAFTNCECGRCGVEMTFPSSSVDVLCESCAIITNSCKHCGGQID